MLEKMEKKELTKKKKQKSKTFVENQNENEIVKINTTFDFASLYTSAADTSIIKTKKLKHQSMNDEIYNKRQTKIEISQDTPIPHKKKLSKYDLNKLKTSTPNAPNENHSTPQETLVKSIMKSNSTFDDSADISNEISTSLESGKRKKRTKSVSFMLDEGEEVSLKKSKPNKIGLDFSNSISNNREKKNIKAFGNNESCTKQLQQVTETGDVVTLAKKKKKYTDVDMRLNENEFNSKSEKKSKKSKNNILPSDKIEVTADLDQVNGSEVSIKVKKDKKKNIEKMTGGEIKNADITLLTEEESNKRKNKKQHKHKTSTAVYIHKGEIDKKSRKIDQKAETVVDDLESLTIGDNPHTLTNLLDEMTVVDKNKKYKVKKTKKVVDTPEENVESDKKDKKDKDKWKKRRLHRKPEFRGNDVTTSIIVDNLPIKLILDYKDHLREHFSKFGLIRRIGIAEVYPTQEPKPVFTTTVYFFSEEAATSALEEDNIAFHMGRMRVRRPLPPTETTLIVKCHAPLDECSLSSTFLSCGRIRSIRKVEKSKKSISSAFIEFNTPKEVEEAINLSSTLRIGGKKVYIAKFEIRNKKHQDEHEDDTKDKEA